MMKKSIEQDFVVLSPAKKATIEKKDASLYERIGANYGDFSGYELTACYDFTEDWPTWEIHPKGDETVILLAGKITFVLKLDRGEKLVTLDKQSDYIVVPRNTWHTAKVSDPCKVLFITPGEGTENKNV